MLAFIYRVHFVGGLDRVLMCAQQDPYNAGIQADNCFHPPI